MLYKLGKLAPVHKFETLRFSDYIKKGLPPAPRKRTWSKAVPDAAWGMLGNDDVGDCTCAAYAHSIQCRTANCNKLANITTEEVLGMYSAISGYDPKDPNTDTGADEISVLDYCKTTGLNDHKILGYIGIELGNVTELTQAMNIFGGVYTGFALPKTSDDQLEKGKPWTFVTKTGDGKPGSLGGHAIYIPDYDLDAPFPLRSRTWNQFQDMSIGFYHYYCDECYAIVTEDWIDEHTQLSPSGFDLKTLISDLKCFRKIV